MLFFELRFILFFLVVFSVYWTLQRASHRKIWLLICSYFFYGCWNVHLLGLIWLSSFIDYAIGKALFSSEDPRRRKLFITSSVVANLTILGFFKYFNFFTESAAVFLSWLGLPATPFTLNILLPIGISFYTFQSMSYTLDIYRGRIKSAATPLDFFLYVAFFPQLVAGPIVRAKTFLPQLREGRHFASIDVRLCLMWFLVGFFKKTCVADYLNLFITYYDQSPAIWFTLGSWGINALYYIQLYCDFSGYTDMAYGCAGLLGYRLCRNFSFPLLAKNVQQFWQRWHISMGSWFRDYVYAPLRGNNKSFPSVTRSIFITFLLVGLWHGAGWKYVIQLGLYGGLMVLYLSFVRLRKRPAGRLLLPVSLDILLLWFVHCLANIFFRAPDLDTAFVMTGSLFSWTAPGFERIHPSLIYFTGLIVAVTIAHYGVYKKWWSEWWRKMSDGWFVLFYGAAWAMVLSLKVQNYTPFIYFQF
ncbi:MAG: MBOAT family O-acyltransferase [Verrucomicrobiota bacterium]